MNKNERLEILVTETKNLKKETTKWIEESKGSAPLLSDVNQSIQTLTELVCCLAMEMQKEEI